MGYSYLQNIVDLQGLKPWSLRCITDSQWQLTCKSLQSLVAYISSQSCGKLCLKFTMPLPAVLFLSCLLLQSNEKAVEGIVNTSLWRKHAKSGGLKYSAPIAILYINDIHILFTEKWGALAPLPPILPPMSTVFRMVGGSGHVVTIQTNYVNILWVTWKNLILITQFGMFASYYNTTKMFL